MGTCKAASNWFKVQRKLLLDSCLDEVLSNIKLLETVSALWGSVCSYLSSNRDRMDYKAYRKRGLLIGSGAIESAHRTVMQRPHRRTGLNRSAQRWSIKGAQRVLNLRIGQMGSRWDLVRQQVEPINYAMVA